MRKGRIACFLLGAVVFSGCAAKIESIKERGFNQKITKTVVVATHNDLSTKHVISKVYLESICQRLSVALTKNNIVNKNIVVSGKPLGVDEITNNNDTDYILSIQILSVIINNKTNIPSGFIEEAVLIDAKTKRELWKATIDARFVLKYEEIADAIIEQLKKDSLI